MMSSALVLGGGGLLGVAWQSGLLHGLQESGVDLAAADTVIGTSAGSIVAALLCTGAPLGPELLERLEESAGPLTIGPDAVSSLLDAMQAVHAADPRDSARRLGEKAMSATTIPEDVYVKVFDELVGQEWPTGLRCAATETARGRVRALDAVTGIPLSRAVAASAAIPTVFPPVRIDGVPHIDGGVIDSLNLDLAAGYDVVVAVSCFTLTAEDGENPHPPIGLEAARAALSEMRKSEAYLELVEPDTAFADLSQGGAAAMNPSLMAEAHAAGQQWGRACALRVRSAFAQSQAKG